MVKTGTISADILRVKKSGDVGGGLDGMRGRECLKAIGRVLLATSIKKIMAKSSLQRGVMDGVREVIRFHTRIGGPRAAQGGRESSANWPRRELF